MEQNNERRDFLKKLGLISVAAAVPAPLVANIPGSVPAKTGAVKIRLVFSIWDDVQVRKTWPNAGYDFRPVMTRITDALNARIPDVEFLPAKAFDAAGVDAVMQSDGEVAGYMVIQMNSWPEAARFLAKKTDKALLFCSWPYSGIGGWDVTNSAIIRSGRKGYAFLSSSDFNDMISTAALFSCLKDGTPQQFAEKAAEYRISHMPEPAQVIVKEGSRECLSPEKTLEAVKGMKILSVEGDNPAMFAQIKEEFGIDVQAVKFGHVESAAAAADPEEAAGIAAKWRTEAQYVEPVTEDRILGCAKLYLGMKSVLKEYGAQAITISCLSGCYGGLLTSYPCLGFMQLQDEGLFGVCEDDIRSTVTMMVFTKMTQGLMGYVSDPVLDSSRRAIIYAHCVATRRFFGPDSLECPFEILTHSEDRLGASVRSIVPAGYPVTTVELDIPNRKMALHTGITIGNDADDRACRTKIVTEVTGDYEKIYTQWDVFGWHRVTFLGDFAPQAEAFARHIGYTVVRES